MTLSQFYVKRIRQLAISWALFNSFTSWIFRLRVSRSFLSLSQFFVKSGLLSSRFFIPTIHAIQFRTNSMSLPLKFTHASVKNINFTFLLQDFRFRFCELMISIFFKNCSRSVFRIREPEERFTFSLTCLMSKECRLCRKMCLDSTLFLCENIAASFPTLSRK